MLDAQSGVKEKPGRRGHCMLGRTPGRAYKGDSRGRMLYFPCKTARKYVRVPQLKQMMCEELRNMTEGHISGTAEKSVGEAQGQAKIRPCQGLKDIRFHTTEPLLCPGPAVAFNFVNQERHGEIWRATL